MQVNRLTRIVDVTAGLAVAGAVGGAVSGVLIVAAVRVIEAGITGFFGLDALVPLGAAAAVGTLIGLVAAPLLSWGILRRVPLGKALLATAIGTVSGAVLGELVWPSNPHMIGLPRAFLGGFVGFVVGGVVARLMSRRRMPSATERVEG